MFTKKQAREHAREYVKSFIEENKKDNDGKIIFTLGTLIELFIAGVEYSFEMLDKEMLKIFEELKNEIIMEEFNRSVKSEEQNGKSNLN